ncbi:MAG: hypothetical protein O7D30_01345 [Rickettsia endosymbiont of Ixodes persulcatus]|nr:hypothetical protein [Rickettsia endosymbiont of Ixodes persulcatus]
MTLELHFTKKTVENGSRRNLGERSDVNSHVNVRFGGSKVEYIKLFAVPESAGKPLLVLLANLEKGGVKEEDEGKRGGGVAGRITREEKGEGVYPPLSTLPSSSSRAALQFGVTGSCKRLSFF